MNSNELSYIEIYTPDFNYILKMSKYFDIDINDFVHGMCLIYSCRFLSFISEYYPDILD